MHLSAWPSQGDPRASFAVPQTAVRLSASLEGSTPDHPSAGALTLQLDGNHGREWRLRPGETAAIDSLQMTLVAVDGWTSLSVIRDPFAPLAAGALALGLVGLGLAVVVRPTAGAAQRASRVCPNSGVQRRAPAAARKEPAV